MLKLRFVYYFKSITIQAKNHSAIMPDQIIKYGFTFDVFIIP